MENPTWAQLELIGGLKLAGKLSEEERFGSKFCRLDVPNGSEFTTNWFSGASVYRITVVPEAIARVLVSRPQTEDDELEHAADFHWDEPPGEKLHREPFDRIRYE